MSAGLIPSTDSFATGDPGSAFFLRAGQPIATVSPLQIVSSDGQSVTSISVDNSGNTTIASDSDVDIFADVAVASLSTAGAIVGGSINADVSSARILFLESTVGVASITLAVPGLTTTGVAFAQQINTGEQVQPVVVACNLGSITLSANAPMTANTDYLVYIVRF